MVGGRCTAPAWAVRAALGWGVWDPLPGLQVVGGLMGVCGKAGGEKTVLGKERGKSGRRRSFKVS